MQGYAAQFSKEISNLLWRVPRELLLLLKTNDCLRSVDHALGQVILCRVVRSRRMTPSVPCVGFQRCHLKFLVRLTGLGSTGQLLEYDCAHGKVSKAGKLLNIHHRLAHLVGIRM